MAFLTKEELHTVAPLDFVDILKGTDSNVIENIIQESIDVFKTYLGSYYDTEKIFLMQGENRNGLLLKNLKKLVLYELKERRKPGGDKDDYNEVMKWLEEIASGKMKADLPLKMEDKDGDGQPDEPVPFMKLGSRKTYRNHW